MVGDSPKCLSTLSGSIHILTMLSFDNLIDVGISNAGPLARLTVDVPLK
jgi:hypothetical protein